MMEGQSKSGWSNGKVVPKTCGPSSGAADFHQIGPSRLCYPRSEWQNIQSYFKTYGTDQLWTQKLGPSQLLVVICIITKPKLQIIPVGRPTWTVTISLVLRENFVDQICIDVFPFCWKLLLSRHTWKYCINTWEYWGMDWTWYVCTSVRGVKGRVSLIFFYSFISPVGHNIWCKIVKTVRSDLKMA